MASGAVFSLYARTVGLNEERDEIHMHFVRKDGVDDGAVEASSVFNGVPGTAQRVATGAARISAAPAADITYCIAWNIGSSNAALNKAVWTANGVQLRTLSLATWTRPITPALSYWALPNDLSCTQ